MSDAPPVVRRTLRPGDLGAIAGAHGRIYAAEHGLDATFEASVAGGLAAAVQRGWPHATAAEGVWIVERDGAFAGSLGLTDEGDGEGRVRWVVLDPAVRGRGLGRRLVGEAVALAAAAGQDRLGLETFSELVTAAHLYREHGFAVVRADAREQWGRERIVMQRYELALRPCAPGRDPGIRRAARA